MKHRRIGYGTRFLATALALGVGLVLSFPAMAAKDAPLAHL